MTRNEIVPLIDTVDSKVDDPPKMIAIIGSGTAGLPAIKTCLDNGFKPVCFEMSANIGGLWCFKPDCSSNESSVMKSTVMNTSKEMMAFSDFPPPASYPTFMCHERVLKYYRAYAEHFDLIRHVRFGTMVTKVEKSDDYEQTGRWKVHAVQMRTYGKTDIELGEKSSELFDAVLVCSGHHAEPYVPHFAGETNYQGRLIHSLHYKESNGYEQKRVVVVGIGNSGADIAVELSRVCAQVYLVTRRGAWVFNRIDKRGDPLDMCSSTRFNAFLGKHFSAIRASATEAKCNNRFDHKAYGLRPPHSVSAQPATVNDDLPNRLACGSIIVKPQIQAFGDDGHSVTFVDGTRVVEIDAVILATGFSVRFPMLEESDVIDVSENKCDLYKHMYPPSLPHPTLAVIGLVQPIGAFAPICEMQARVACAFLSGTAKRRFPTREAMLRDIARKAEKLRRRYVNSRRCALQVDYVPFMDELASIVGCKPRCNVWAFVHDPALWRALVFGPTVAYQYRLNGSHHWPGAAEAVHTAWYRSRNGLRACAK